MTRIGNIRKTKLLILKQAFDQSTVGLGKGMYGFQKA